jgi:hypothetical protein
VVGRECYRERESWWWYTAEPITIFDIDRKDGR